MKWKWEPLVAMVSLFLLGLWIVYAPSIRHTLRPGAEIASFTMGGVKGELEMVAEPAGANGKIGHSFRMLFRDGTTTNVDAAELKKLLGPAGYEDVVRTSGNWMFRVAKVSSWAGFFWVIVGFVGQMLFFGRMFVQWLVAEKEKKAVIPESFWWFSFFGGLMLFTYFAWRQDIIGVIGQTSGVVIYARNLRLIHKQRRRDARAAALQAATAEAFVRGDAEDAAAEVVR